MDVEVHAFVFLPVGDRVAEASGLRIAVWTKHPHQAFGALPSQRAEGLKADGGVDVIAQHGFASVCIVCQEAVHSLGHEGLCTPALRP